MRIQEFLQEKEKYTVKDLEELQMDQKNLYGKEFTPIFLKELNKASLNEVEKEGVDQLTKWNFTIVKMKYTINIPFVNERDFKYVIFKRNTERCNEVI